MGSWVVYTKGRKLPLWKSDNKNDLELIVKQLPNHVRDKLFIAKKLEKNNV